MSSAAASPASPRQTVERFLAAVVTPSPGDMADCYASRAVIEMPFASGLAPERMQTSREEIRARFAPPMIVEIKILAETKCVPDAFSFRGNQSFHNHGLIMDLHGRTPLS
jgi:hypothetical protein